MYIYDSKGNIGSKKCHIWNKSSPSGLHSQMEMTEERGIKLQDKFKENIWSEKLKKIIKQNTASSNSATLSNRLTYVLES